MTKRITPHFFYHKIITCIKKKKIERWLQIAGVPYGPALIAPPYTLLGVVSTP